MKIGGCLIHANLLLNEGLGVQIVDFKGKWLVNTDDHKQGVEHNVVKHDERSLSNTPFNYLREDRFMTGKKYIALNHWPARNALQYVIPCCQ